MLVYHTSKTEIQLRGVNGQTERLSLGETRILGESSLHFTSSNAIYGLHVWDDVSSAEKRMSEGERPPYLYELELQQDYDKENLDYFVEVSRLFIHEDKQNLDVNALYESGKIPNRNIVTVQEDVGACGKLHFVVLNYNLIKSITLIQHP